jgi:hypothetical protein
MCYTPAMKLRLVSAIPAAVIIAAFGAAAMLQSADAAPVTQPAAPAAHADAPVNPLETISITLPAFSVNAPGGTVTLPAFSVHAPGGTITTPAFSVIGPDHTTRR